MLPKINAQDIDRIRASADIIEEVSDMVTYMGFCLKGTTDETAAEWSIMKITQDSAAQPIVTRFQWAEGYSVFNLKWSERATYNYYFRKF